MNGEKLRMTFLVIGLGSMGKRRIRCLKTLNYSNIYGFDLRVDRRAEVEEKYRIKTFSDFATAVTEVRPTALIISVPPDVHHVYMKKAIEHKIHFFVEASVVDTDMDIIIEDVKKASIVSAPSATAIFHPAIQILGNLLKKGSLGKISNILYHAGQYLPDWHTYEPVGDYYVSNPITGGAREIVPFEMTWMTLLFGFPKRVCGNFRKTIHIKGAENIDDTYNFLLDYGDFLASVTIDAVSRHATRRLIINGDRMQLVWDWDDRNVKLFNPHKKRWEIIQYEMKAAQEGYNENIGEMHYIEELKSFINTVQGRGKFINTLEMDHKVLKLLYAIEESDKISKYVNFSV
jgi:predicted dehydrogenase